MGNRDPISAYVKAPHKAINPPAIHARKKMEGVYSAGIIY